MKKYLIVLLPMLFLGFRVHARPVISQEITGLRTKICDGEKCILLSATNAVISKYRPIYALRDVTIIRDSKVEKYAEAIWDWQTQEMSLSGELIVNLKNMMITDKLGESL